MPESESERKRQLECLRLASDLEQLAKEEYLEPAMKAHCLRMARAWTYQAERAAPSVNARYRLN